MTRPYTTVGEREIHSADGKDYIIHAGEHQWVVVWRDTKQMPFHKTRKVARSIIRAMKRFRPGTQLLLPGTA